MKRTIEILLSCLLATLVCALMTGCSHDCAQIYFCATGGAGGTNTGGGGDSDLCPEDPATGQISPSCGIWVSALLGDDASPGTQDLPVRSLSRAIDLAEATAEKASRRVYACGGDSAGETYIETVKVRPGISVYGGFGCSEGWRYIGKDKRAVIAPMVPDMVALTVTEGAGGETGSFLADLQMRAESAVESGGSSIAALALDGASATFLRSQFVAGDGADGTQGAPGSHDGTVAMQGPHGTDGADACTAAFGNGGISNQATCAAGGTTTGGAGGIGAEGVAGDGAPGLEPPAINPTGYGSGGKAEDPNAGTACTGGISGAAAPPGAAGAVSTRNGRLTPLGFIGEAGGDGEDGLPGQGGGGGGGSVGGAVCGGMPHGGAGGGAGGAGGCGGLGGKGGQAGGSSIGVAIRHATITFVDTGATTGNGGRGGNGGAGQPGGQGGLPGLGGLGFGGLKGGCAGGAGGQGGRGGDGAGGNGGHSIGAGALAAANIIGLLNDATLGAVGLGGVGGNEGRAGTATDILRLDP